MTEIATIQTARAERLKSALESLAHWAEKRAREEHNTETTLAMLRKRAVEIEGQVDRAGWAAANAWLKQMQEIQAHALRGDPEKVETRLAKTYGLPPVATECSSCGQTDYKKNMLQGVCQECLVTDSRCFGDHS